MGKKRASAPRRSSPRECKRSQTMLPPSPDLRFKKDVKAFAAKVEAEAVAKVQASVAKDKQKQDARVCSFLGERTFCFIFT
jgi:hypothetical protein